MISSDADFFECSILVIKSSKSVASAPILFKAYSIGDSRYIAWFHYYSYFLDLVFYGGSSPGCIRFNELAFWEFLNRFQV